MDITTRAVNALRILSVEQIQEANSGHPGLPLGAAPIAYAIWSNMNFDYRDSKYVNRDRFILSAGHGSALNYSLLHLFGVSLTKQDLMSFRQTGSLTAGHPEYGHTVGIEVSTGPLGQGVANGVGMAIAEAHLASKFNRDGYNIVDHYTYVLTGDGCMQEGIQYEAASLAGTLGLGKLIVLYDKNNITIEGNTDIAFTEDVGKRHIAQGWQVIDVADANDVASINKAIKKAKKTLDKPTLIICRSVIGYSSPLQGSEHCHGSPLGQDNVQQMRRDYGFGDLPPFEVPQDVVQHYKALAQRSARSHNKHKALLKKYKTEYPTLYQQYCQYYSGKLPDIDYQQLLQFDKPDATRNTSYTVLNQLSHLIPNLIGGSADLGPSNKSIMKDKAFMSKSDMSGENIHFGIREHAMAAISNGIAVHGGLIPYCATFFVFSDYMKNAIRLSALMKLPVIYILTHDSIGVGEDGPTHQPVEQLAGLRAIPDLRVFRPADGKETAVAWIRAVSDNVPTCLVLSRQNLPQYDGGLMANKGGYILSDSNKPTPDCILIATGSEVEIVMQAQQLLKTYDIDARVVSMPCLELFEQQSQQYKDSVLPDNIRARVAVEAATTSTWYKYVGLDGAVVGIDTFGESGKYNELYQKYGITPQNVVATTLKVLGR